MKNGVATVSFNFLNKAIFANQLYKQRRRGSPARHYARRLSESHANFFPEDLDDRVFSRAFVDQFGADPYELIELKNKALFLLAALAAIRSVGTSYAPAGCGTRLSSKEISNALGAQDVGSIADKYVIEHWTVLDSGGTWILDFDQLGDPRDLSSQHNLEDRIGTVQILQNASKDVGGEFRLIYFKEGLLEAVAASFYVTRFSLNRRIACFFSTWRWEA